MVNLLPTANCRRNLKLRTADGHVRCRSAKSGDKCFDSLCKHPLITRICLGNYHDLIMNICVRLLIQQHDLSFHPLCCNKVRSCFIDFHHIKTPPVQNYLRQIQFTEFLISSVSFCNFFFQLILQSICRQILRQHKILNFQPGQIIPGNLHHGSRPH